MDDAPRVQVRGFAARMVLPPGRWRGCIAMVGSLACLEPPSVDVEGPHVVSSSLSRTRTVEVEVWPTIEVRFSEALDAATVRPETVALVSWELGAACDRTPLCERGRCERGTCSEDPLTRADLARIADGKFEPTIPLELGLDPDASVLRVRPARTLRPFTRHALIVGAGVRDRHGGPLVGDDGLASAWRRDLVTGKRGSSGPDPQLVLPEPASTGSPPNLQELRVAFPLPVRIDDPEMSMSFVSALGHEVRFERARPCPGWAPGFCLAFTPTQDLMPASTYHLGHIDVHDVWGRGSVPPPATAWFRTSETFDRDAPDATLVDVRWRERCVVASQRFSEPVALVVEVAGRRASADTGNTVAAVRLSDRDVAGRSSVGGRIIVTDAAGNLATREFELPTDPAFDPEVSRVVLNEVLANPLGAEPGQEFVELVNVDDEPASLGGLRVVDREWSDVAQAVQGGESPPGDALPDIDVPPNGIVILVGASFVVGAGDDAPPVAGATIVRLASSLGDSGLKNDGEPLSVFAVDPLALVSSYANALDTGSTTHAGRSVVRASLDACDVRTSWRSHPSGSATPGGVP